MSTTTLYRLYKTKVTPFNSYQNGWLSAPKLWDHLAQKYLNRSGLFGDDKELWALARNPDVPKSFRLAHAFTFDYAYIPPKHFAMMAAVCWEIGAKLPGSHWSAIGSDLAEMSKLRDWRLQGAALCCTSVNDIWWRFPRRGDEPWDCVEYVHSIDT